MALVEVYGGQLEELSFQANHRCIIIRKYLMCVRCHGKYRQYWQSFICS